MPGVIIRTYPEICRQVAAQGHEIGHHGWSHVPPAALAREQEQDGLVRGNRAIEELCGRRARGYRSPAWDLSPHTVERHTRNARYRSGCHTLSGLVGWAFRHGIVH